MVAAVEKNPFFRSGQRIDFMQSAAVAGTLWKQWVDDHPPEQPPYELEIEFDPDEEQP